MTDPSRRNLLGYAALGVGSLVSSGALFSDATAQAPPFKPPLQNPPVQPPRFGFADVVKRAQDLSAAPFDGSLTKLPEGLANLDFDGWRDIRFKTEKNLLGAQPGPFRLQLFHLGHLYRRPVTINTIRDGIATPIPYSQNLFDYGQTKFDRQMPVNTGFAGFRLHYPLNDPHVYDELCSFVGASYFRILGRGQRYGISARALAVAAGTNQEEFPFFREFWIETPDPRADRATFFGLLDGQSVTGAYRFDLYPGEDTGLEVSATLFPRRPNVKFGLAPLTSMYFLGENDRRDTTEFRTELHDSDGLWLEGSNNERLWRPLRNPQSMAISSFLDKDIRGFGLLQRDRNFASYQDLDLAYQLRPSYWVEPRESFGEGHVELIELPTTDETNDNIVASFVPKESPETGKAFTFSYRLLSAMDLEGLAPNGSAVNTFQTAARALGSRETPPPRSRRFIIDFTGGDLAYFSADANLVEAVASITRGSILRSFVIANPYVKGIRAVIDVQAPVNETGDIRVFLRANGRTLTETWTFPWSAQ